MTESFAGLVGLTRQWALLDEKMERLEADRRAFEAQKERDLEALEAARARAVEEWRQRVEAFDAFRLQALAQLKETAERMALVQRLLDGDQQSLQEGFRRLHLLRDDMEHLWAASSMHEADAGSRAPIEDAAAAAPFAAWSHAVSPFPPLFASTSTPGSGGRPEHSVSPARAPGARSHEEEALGSSCDDDDDDDDDDADADDDDDDNDDQSDDGEAADPYHLRAQRAMAEKLQAQIRSLHAEKVRLLGDVAALRSAHAALDPGAPGGMAVPVTPSSGLHPIRRVSAVHAGPSLALSPTARASSVRGPFLTAAHSPTTSGSLSPSARAPFALATPVSPRGSPTALTGSAHGDGAGSQPTPASLPRDRSTRVLTFGDPAPRGEDRNRVDTDAAAASSSVAVGPARVRPPPPPPPPHPSRRVGTSDLATEEERSRQMQQERTQDHDEETAVMSTTRSNASHGPTRTLPSSASPALETAIPSRASPAPEGRSPRSRPAEVVVTTSAAVRMRRSSSQEVAPRRSIVPANMTFRPEDLEEDEEDEEDEEGVDGRGRVVPEEYDEGDEERGKDGEEDGEDNEVGGESDPRARKGRDGPEATTDGRSGVQDLRGGRGGSGGAEPAAVSTPASARALPSRSSTPVTRASTATVGDGTISAATSAAASSLHLPHSSSSSSPQPLPHPPPHASYPSHPSSSGRPAGSVAASSAHLASTTTPSTPGAGSHTPKPTVRRAPHMAAVVRDTGGAGDDLERGRVRKFGGMASSHPSSSFTPSSPSLASSSSSSSSSSAVSRLGTSLEGHAVGGGMGPTDSLHGESASEAGRVARRGRLSIMMKGVMRAAMAVARFTTLAKDGKPGAATTGSGAVAHSDRRGSRGSRSSGSGRPSLSESTGMQPSSAPAARDESVEETDSDAEDDEAESGVAGAVSGGAGARARAGDLAGADSSEEKAGGEAAASTSGGRGRFGGFLNALGLTRSPSKSAGKESKSPFAKEPWFPDWSQRWESLSAWERLSGNVPRECLAPVPRPLFSVETPVPSYVATPHRVARPIPMTLALALAPATATERSPSRAGSERSGDGGSVPSSGGSARLRPGAAGGSDRWSSAGHSNRSDGLGSGTSGVPASTPTATTVSLGSGAGRAPGSIGGASSGPRVGSAGPGMSGALSHPTSTSGLGVAGGAVGVGVGHRAAAVSRTSPDGSGRRRAGEGLTPLSTHASVESGASFAGRSRSQGGAGRGLAGMSREGVSTSRGGAPLGVVPVVAGGDQAWPMAPPSPRGVTRGPDLGVRRGGRLR